MKKTSIIVLFVLVSWVGTTAYIGNKVKSEAGTFLGGLQNTYKELGMELEVKIIESSFFTSKAESTMTYTDPAMQSILEGIYNLPFKTTYNIEHGPIFFKNGLNIGFARVTTKEDIFSHLNPDMKTALGLDNEKLILSSHSIISFNNQITGKMFSTPLKFENKDANMGIDMKGYKGSFNFNLDTLSGTGNIAFPSLKVFDPEHPTINYFNSKDLTLTFDIKKFIADGFYVGDINMHAKEITLAGIDNDDDTMDKLLFSSNIDINIEEDNDKNINILYALGAEHISGKIPEEFMPEKLTQSIPNPQSASIKMKLGGLSVKGLKAFQAYSNEMQKTSQTLMANLSSTNREKAAKSMAKLETFYADMQNKMIDLGQDIFAAKKGTIGFDVQFKEYNATQNKLSFDMAYIGDKQKGTPEEILENLKKHALELFTVNIDMSVDANILSRIESIMNEREKQKFSMMLMTGTTIGIIDKNKDTYTLKADYTPNKLILNGKDKTDAIKMMKQKAGL